VAVTGAAPKSASADASAHAHSDKLRIVKINTENYPALASKYKVRAMPRAIAACSQS
jgi:hypothetical protein